jgi:hypothetical protein
VALAPGLLIGPTSKRGGLLRRRSGRAADEKVLYFYCSQEHRRNEPEVVLRTLLKEAFLLSELPSMSMSMSIQDSLKERFYRNEPLNLDQVREALV